MGRWLFAWVLLAQVGHLIEHIAKTITGSGLLGSALDSELSHLAFNGAIAVLAAVLWTALPRNPWVLPLATVAAVHGVEHVYIFSEFLREGLTDGPGLLGKGGALDIIPLDRLDLHNMYNGGEMVLLGLGFWHETEVMLETED